MGETSFLLSLEYDVSLVPPSGSEVLRPGAAPIKHVGKDAAGHRFHDYALKQAGLYGEYMHSSQHQMVNTASERSRQFKAHVLAESEASSTYCYGAIAES